MSDQKKSERPAQPKITKEYLLQLAHDEAFGTLTDAALSLLVRVDTLDRANRVLNAELSAAERECKDAYTGMN